MNLKCRKASQEYEIMIRGTHSLAEIPPDVLNPRGKITAADVYSVSGFKKLKRSEIAIAIDHQAVDLYDVLR